MPTTAEQADAGNIERNWETIKMARPCRLAWALRRAQSVSNPEKEKTCKTHLRFIFVFRLE